MAQNLLLTKIIATLGPATADRETISMLIREGARAFRINFSHGTFDDHRKSVENVRNASKETGCPVALLGDLSGPKIRVGKVIDGGIQITAGKKVIFQQQDILTEENEREIIFSTNYISFLDEVKPGEPVLLDDGNVRLEAEEILLVGNEKKLICRVLEGGLITSNKGVNLPETDLTVSALTPKDHKCIDFAIENEFDLLALSFVRKAEDLVELKNILKEKGARPLERSYENRYENDQTLVEGEFKGFIPVVAKIEKPQAVRDLDSILKETDMVMVARGDLGVEMDLSEVAVLQKSIIKRCRHFGVPVIVATQMLQSMINEPAPTRAEVSDVANAILDGTDAVMLSGETAVGKYPVSSVKMMNRVINKTNSYILRNSIAFPPPERTKDLTFRSGAIAAGVKSIVMEMDAELIVVWTELGGAAVFLSEQRIPKPIIVYSHVDKTLNLAAILYGLIPVFMERSGNSDEFMEKAVEDLEKRTFLSKIKPLVFVHRNPFTQVGLTNEITIKYFK